MIDSKGYPIKYSINHWEHLNRGIVEIIHSINLKVGNWASYIDKVGLLELLNDCCNSA